MGKMPAPSVREIIEQFRLDAPRIHLFIDGERETPDTPEYALAQLMNRGTSLSAGTRLVYWCTQTALAPFYLDKLRELNPRFDTDGTVEDHLVDDGPQCVRVHDEFLSIDKPFRVMRLNDYTPRLLRRLRLVIRVAAVGYAHTWHEEAEVAAAASEPWYCV